MATLRNMRNDERRPSQSRFLVIDGLRVHCQIAGTGSPVVLLHGFPTSSYLWRRIVPRLSAIRRVIAPDLPGYGLSDKPEPRLLTFEYYSHILDALIRQLDVKRTAFVVHDLGGPVGLLWAIRHRHQVERLVILNTLATPEYSLSDKVILALLGLPVLRRAFATRWLLARILRRAVFDPANMPDELVQQYLEPFRSSAARNRLMQTFAAPLKVRGRPELSEIRATLAELEVPIHLIYGECDPWCAGYMRELRRALPSVRVTALPSCGHLVPEEQADLLIDRLLDDLGGEAQMAQT
jgi:pimeloyl-ACP methyl ester carboxylesterase